MSERNKCWLCFKVFKGRILKVKDKSGYINIQACQSCAKQYGEKND